MFLAVKNGLMKFDAGIFQQYWVHQVRKVRLQVLPLKRMLLFCSVSSYLMQWSRYIHVVIDFIRLSICTSVKNIFCKLTNVFYFLHPGLL
jgi:hypothetical protein